MLIWINFYCLSDTVQFAVRSKNRCVIIASQDFKIYERKAKFVENVTVECNLPFI